MSPLKEVRAPCYHKQCSIDLNSEGIGCVLHLLIARHMFSKPRHKYPRNLTTFLETNNLVLSLPRCASAPQRRRRRRRPTMAAAAHEISLRGIFRRKALPPRAFSPRPLSSVRVRPPPRGKHPSTAKEVVVAKCKFSVSASGLCMETACRLHSADSRKFLLSYRVLLCSLLPLQ